MLAAESRNHYLGLKLISTRTLELVTPRCQKQEVKNVKYNAASPLIDLISSFFNLYLRSLQPPAAGRVGLVLGKVSVAVGLFGFRHGAVSFFLSV